MRAIYVAYLTGIAGNSLGLFFIGDGAIAGVDVGGMKYDGNYSIDPSSGNLEGEIRFSVPASVPLITGVSGGPESLEMISPITLPGNFAEGEVVAIRTIVGNINARFEKLKEL
jgi:hypothetical protein